MATVASVRGCGAVEKSRLTLTTNCMKQRTTYHSPLGIIHLAGVDGLGLSGLYFEGQRHWPQDFHTWVLEDQSDFSEAITWLDAYFAGRLLAELPPHHFDRGTAFQKMVWQALAAIPAGQTWSYGELAKRLGSPPSVRAVAAAVGRNPLSLMIPCHRVIGADGSLTGYAGGVEKKAWLLAHEQQLKSTARTLRVEA
jgi:methylated-DNA-[protein]-cysteine S-methyltransferase